MAGRKRKHSLEAIYALKDQGFGRWKIAQILGIPSGSVDFALKRRIDPTYSKNKPVDIKK